MCVPQKIQKPSNQSKHVTPIEAHTHRHTHTKSARETQTLAIHCSIIWTRDAHTRAVTPTSVREAHDIVSFSLSLSIISQKRSSLLLCLLVSNVSRRRISSKDHIPFSALLSLPLPLIISSQPTLSSFFLFVVTLSKLQGGLRRVSVLTLPNVHLLPVPIRCTHASCAYFRRRCS